VYDMYPWDSAGPGGRTPEHPGTPRRHGDPPSPRAPLARTPQAEGAQAVQVALDRRDNGGDAAGAASQPTAGPTRQ
jgi:hypothetical protein